MPDSKAPAPIVNRVANSGIKVVNLENFFPENEIIVFDIKPYLFKELILKEKDFRASLKAINWADYKDKIVLINNSADAIIPVWAYMLISSNLTEHASEIFQGDTAQYLSLHYNRTLVSFDAEVYQDERVIIKGCSNKPVPPSAYAQLTQLLKPYAQSIMYGEPCSTVPIFKRPRKLS